MKIGAPMADGIILEELGRRLVGHRLQRNLSQAELAHEAGVSKRTVERVEAGGSAQLTSLIRILRALDRLEGLDALIAEPIVSPLERLELATQARKKTRRRASLARKAARATSPTKPWKWGDEA
jgi:transcriptional regulator with XRE-family HTH domain